MEDFKLIPAKGTFRKKGKRKGQGPGSGNGKTAGKGHKGQKARSGGGIPYLGFEGGQMRIGRRLPKRGFTNAFKKDITVVNVGRLNIFSDGDIVTKEELIKHGVIRKNSNLVKLLGNGDLEKKLIVKLYSASDSAKEKLEQSGSTFESIYVETKYYKGKEKIKKAENKSN
jgi:large subunit ribosomal protein L15